MTYLVTLGCAILMASASAASAPAATPVTGDFRWVVGVVIAASPTSLSLRLRDRVLTLIVDSSTDVIRARPALTSVPASAPVGSLAVGTLVRAHYLDRQGKRAVVIVVDDATSEPLSRSNRAGTSLRGELKHVRSRAVSVRVDHKSRDIILDDHTTLFDRDGHALATGTKAIAAVLPAGVDLLVTWAPYWIVEADGSVNSYYLSAVEIRTLTRVSERTADSEDF